MSHLLRTTNVFQMDHRRYFSLCPVSQKLVKSVDYLLLMEQQCVSKRANCWCIFKTCSETKCIYHHCIWTAVNICGTKPDFSTVGFVCVGFFCLGNPGLKRCRIEKMNIVGCYLKNLGKAQFSKAQQFEIQSFNYNTNIFPLEASLPQDEEQHLVWFRERLLNISFSRSFLTVINILGNKLPYFSCCVRGGILIWTWGGCMSTTAE